MKKRLLTAVKAALICVVIATLFCVTSASALSLNVYDNASIFTQSEKAELNEMLAGLGEEHQAEVSVLTVDSCNNTDVDSFAELMYDSLGIGMGKSGGGVLIVYNTGKADGMRNVAIFASGTARERLDDSRINKIFDKMIPFLEAEENFAGFQVFADECDRALSGEISIPFYQIPLAIGIAFVIALIIVGIEASKLKMVHRKTDAASYVDEVRVTASQDRFLYRNVRKTPIPKNTTKSSGSTRGGSGRSF